MPALGLKSMSIEKLSKLQAEVEAALSAKVVEERRELEAKLIQLSRLGDGHVRVRGVRGGGRTGARGPVAPKYRNPENPSETLGRSWPEAPLAQRRDEVRQEIGRFRHRRKVGGHIENDAEKDPWQASQDGISPVA